LQPLGQSPIREKINRVDRRRAELSSVELSAEQGDRLSRWIEVEFVYSNLWLRFGQASRERVVEIISLPGPVSLRSEDELLALRALAALREVDAAARAGNSFTMELIRRISGGAGLRGASAAAGQTVEPPPPEQISLSLEAACWWFAADSFMELHAVEQAAIAHLRLIEIQPFEAENDLMARLAASFFLIRSGFPPLIVSPARAGDYRRATEEGLRMNTRPMIEFVVEAIEDSLLGIAALAGI
jgi:hypothetical protein